MASLRWIDTDLDRPRWRGTLNYRLHRRLQVGVEYNIAAGEVGPLVTAFLLTETERRPALFLGLSSDRVGSPEGTESYYLTAAKYVSFLHAGPYLSLAWSEWDRRFNVPFGLNIELGRGYSVRPMYDGQRTHLLLNRFDERWGISVIYAWLERAGVSLSVGF